MEGVAEGVGRRAIEEAEVVEAAEGVGVLLAVEEEADGGFAGETVGGELPATGATEEVEIVVGEFVETADERVADATRTEPQEGVEERVLEGGAAVDVGRVVGVALEVDAWTAWRPWAGGIARPPGEWRGGNARCFGCSQGLCR